MRHIRQRTHHAAKQSHAAQSADRRPSPHTGADPVSYTHLGKSPIGLPYRSICSVPMDHEKFAQVSELRRQAEAEADPARKEALTAQANQLSAKAFTPIYDREKLWVDLEADKAARLQKIIAEEIAKYDAAHQG